MAAERKPDWEVVEGRRNDNPWKAGQILLSRASGIATYRATMRVRELIEKDRRERRETITVLLFVAMGSAIIGAAIFKLLLHLH
jgi:hypothetical protein